MQDGPSQPLIELSGILYATDRDSQDAPYLIADDLPGARTFETLPPAQRKRVVALLEQKGCACVFCKKLQKNAVKLPDIGALKAKGPQSTKFTSIRKALAWPHMARGLFLSSKGLQELPTTVGKLKNLKILWLWENGLSTLPDTLADLGNLTRLNLNENAFTDVPEVVTRLPQLEHLEIGENPLQSLTPELARVKTLKAISLSFNYHNPLFHPFPEVLTTIPSIETFEIVEAEGWAEALMTLDWGHCFPNLKRLQLAVCGLNRVPEGLRICAKLEYIDLLGNKLNQVPDWFGELTELQTVGFNQCGLNELPDSISQLSKLKWLNLSGNQLKRVLDLSAMTKMENLYLDDCPLEAFPKGVDQMGSLDYLALRGIPQGEQWAEPFQGKVKHILL